jgi:hypothetical protein
VFKNVSLWHSDEVREQVANFNVKKHITEKSPEVSDRILTTLKGNFLFEHLVGSFAHGSWTDFSTGIWIVM